MALTRKLLEGMGIEDKQVETIIEAHSETVNGLKADRDKYKEQAQKVPDLQKQLEEAKSATDGGDEWQRKFDEERKAFEDFKAEVEAERAKEAKAQAYRKQVLGTAGVAAQYMDDVMSVTKLDDIELDDDGNIKDAEKLAEAAKDKWKSFVTKTETKGSNPANPPKETGGVEGADPEVAKRMQARNERMFGKNETKE